MDDVILSYDDKSIDYSNITLCLPSSINGGSYFTKLQYCKKPLYMQSPTCVSKQGIVHSGKKTYIDFVFTSEKDGEFISFLENLEKKCIDIIYDKRQLWFNDDLEKNDIETAFASLVKSYKNGTSHTLRVNINSGNSSNSSNSKFNNIGGVQSCFIFDEENNMLSFDNVKPETSLITIIDFEGIKFTSKSFQFEINARQMLIINEKPIFKSCLIKQKKQEHNPGDKCEDGEQEQLSILVTTDADTNATANANDAPLVVSVSTKANVVDIVDIVESSSSSPPVSHLETLEPVESVPLESVEESHLEELSLSSSVLPSSLLLSLLSTLFKL